MIMKMLMVLRMTAYLEISFFIMGGIVEIFEKKDKEKSNTHIKYGLYEKIFKRPLDFFLALNAIIVLCPILLVIALLVKIKIGSPVIFSQPRPGLNEKVFKLHKFRSMTNDKDENGELLPDELRLTKFGEKLRNTSFDELPELFDILLGNLSIVGPRPQLIRDMVFMSSEQRKRHEVMPGLTGLAQVNGRNSLDWEEKLNYDLNYAGEITFLGDLKIVFKTIGKAIISKEGITEEGMATATDFGDYLLKHGKISHEEYDIKQKEAREILQNR